MLTSLTWRCEIKKCFGESGDSMNTKQTLHIGALICFDGLVLFWRKEEIALTYTLPTLHSAQGPSAAFLSPFSGNSSF